MDKKQYNNVSDWTLKHGAQAQSEDSLQVTRAICNELGVALPQGDLVQVAEVLATDDYMGWKACTKEEAQEAANNGVPAIGISNDQIVMLVAEDEEQPVANAVAVMTLANDAMAMGDSMTYYSYSCGTTCQGGGDDAPAVPTRKAIIIVPGVMGTELKLTTAQRGLSAGTQVWPPIQGDEDFSDIAVINKTLDKLASIDCDASGNSVYDLCVKNDDNYGAFDQYKTLYNKLKSTYSATHDVIFFGYDWRKPNAVSGDLLRQKVTEYDCVIIVAHSMGGLVTSHMLKDTAIRQKIEKVITLGTPYLGSLEMLPVMSHGHFGYINTALENLPKFIAWIAKESVLQPVLQAMAVDIPSLYELLPTEKFFSLDNRWYYSIKYLFTGTEKFKTFSSTKTWIQIARDEKALGDFNTQLFDNAISAHSSLWLDNSHITSKVDTYYLVGDDYDTMRTYTFKDGFADSYSTTSVTAGDGTVLSYSAALNDMYSSKTYFTKANHNDLISRSNVLSFIERIINNDFSLPSGIQTNPINTV